MVSTHSSSLPRVNEIIDARPYAPATEEIAPELRQLGDISYIKFLETALGRGHQFTRNSAGFVVDALYSLGFTEEYHYGRVINVPSILSNPELLQSRDKPEVPRDHEETVCFVLNQLGKLSNLAIPNKGILLYGEPGGGKNLIVDTILKVTEHYSRYHPDGYRCRLAITWPKNTPGFDTAQSNGYARNGGLDHLFNGSNGTHHHSNGSANGNGSSKGKHSEPQQGYYKASASNVSPFALMNAEYDFVFEMTGNMAYADQVSGRSRIIAALKESSPKEGINLAYVSTSTLGADLITEYQSMVNYYMNRRNLKLADAIETVRNECVTVQPYRFNSSLGEGILIKLPQSDENGEAWPMAGHGFSHTNVPAEFREGERDPVAVEAAVLRADIIHLEDGLLTQRPLVWLNQFIERGVVQIEHASERGMYHRPTKLIRIEGKDCLTFMTTNLDDIRAREDSPGFAALRSRFTSVMAPFIRNYRAQAEKISEMLGTLDDDRKVTPHVADVAALFFTATRLVDPKPAYYEATEFEEAKGALQAKDVVSKLKGGVAKALYLGSTPANRGLSLLDHLLVQPLSVEEFRVLDKDHVRYRVAHEYFGQASDINDGGFGISPRRVQDVMVDIINHRSSGDLTVRDVIDALKAKEGDFDYNLKLRSMRQNTRLKLYAALCEKKNVDAVEPNDIDSTGSLSVKEKEQLRNLWVEAGKQVRDRFPISDPVDIVTQLERYAKGLVIRDIKIGLKQTDEAVTDRLLRYVMHLRTYAVPDITLPDYFRVVKKEFSTPDNGNSANTGVDVNFMESVERDFSGAQLLRSASIDTSRRELWNSIGNAATDLVTKTPGISFPEIFQGLIKSNPTCESMLKHLRTTMQNQGRPKVDEFLSNIEKYYEQPDQLARHLQDGTKKDGAEAWSDAWQYLINQGYTDSSLPGLVYWAFRDDSAKKDARK